MSPDSSRPARHDRAMEAVAEPENAGIGEPFSQHQVGYCSPPLHTRFPKGRSGNPKGRPKGARSLASIWSSVWNEKLTVTENGRRRRISKRQAAVKQLANKAASGNQRAIEAMLRAEQMHLLEGRTRGSEAPLTAQPPLETNPTKVALAVLSVLRAAKAEQSS